MIQINGLTKEFNNQTALKNVSFSVDGVGVYGVIGHTDAGKSTLLKILSANDSDYSGEVVIDGISAAAQPLAIKQRIGYLSDDNPMWDDMTVLEFLTFIAQAKKIPETKAYSQIEELSELFELEGIRDRLIKNLSKSERRLLGAARTLLGNPSVIILDEPFKHLTQEHKKVLKSAIEIFGKFKTVLISHPKPSEISDVCERFILLVNGQLMTCDTPQRIKKKISSITSLEITASGEKNDILGVLNGISGFESLDCAELPCETSGAVKLKIEYSGQTDFEPLIKEALEGAKIPLLSVNSHSPTLDGICFVSAKEKPLPRKRKIGFGKEKKNVSSI